MIKGWSASIAGTCNKHVTDEMSEVIADNMHEQAAVAFSVSGLYLSCTFTVPISEAWGGVDDVTDVALSLFRYALVQAEVTIEIDEIHVRSWEVMDRQNNA